MPDIDLVQRCAHKAEQTYTSTKWVALHTRACGSSNSYTRSSNRAELANRDSLAEEQVVEEDDCRNREDLRELKEADRVVRQGEVAKDEEA
jgi:hypothetical protein